MVFSKFFHSNSGKSEEITPPKKPETFPEKKETCLKKAESFEFYSLFIIKFIDSCICRVLGSSETFSPIAIMKVKELEEQQGRNIYLSWSEYLYTKMLPWTTPSPYKKKLLTLYGPMRSLEFQFGPMTTYSASFVKRHKSQHSDHPVY